MAEEKRINLEFDKENSKKERKGFLFARIKGKTSFSERLRAFSKRDLVWLIIGVIILILAPIAEYFLSKPKTNTALTPGFGERRMLDSSIYEPGINALSAGSPDGMEEVIAPLTARDPASLILGAKKEKETPPPMPFTPPKEKDKERDSIADVGRKGFSEAVKSSPAPFIPPKMHATLRGASSFFGGGESSRTSASLSSSKIIAEAKKAPTQTQKKTIVGSQAIPGFKGVASRADSVNKGAFEKLRAQADKAADYFSQPKAKEALENAAAASINPVGDGGFGSIRDGGKSAGFSNNTIRDSRAYSPGDPCRGSIERELYCQEQRKKKDFEMWWKYELPKQFLATAIFDPISKKIAKEINDLLNPQPPSPPPKYCWKTATQKVAVIVNKRQDGEIQLVPNVGINDCPCGFLTPQPDPSCRESSGGGSSSSSAQATTSNSSAEGASSTEASPFNFEKFDLHLKEAIQAARAGEEARDVATLKMQAIKSAENIEQAIAVAQSITQHTLIGPEAVFKKIAEYDSEIDKVDEVVKLLRKDYDAFYKEINEFENTLKKAIADYNAGKIKPKFAEGVAAETLGGGKNISEKLEEALQTIKKIKEETDKVKEEYLVRFERGVKSHRAAYIWYANQVNIAKNIAQSIYTQTGGHASEVKTISSQIRSIADNTADPATIDLLKELFTYLTGRIPQNLAPAQPQPLPRSGSILVELPKKMISHDFRMAAKDDKDKITLLIKWRGADEKKAWYEVVIDTSAEFKREKDVFDKVKPSAKFEKGEFPLSFENLPSAESFLVPIMRNVNLKKDVEKTKELVGGVVAASLNGYEVFLKASKAALKDLKEELKPVLNQLEAVTSPSSPPSSSQTSTGQSLSGGSTTAQPTQNPNLNSNSKPKPDSSKPASQSKPKPKKPHASGSNSGNNITVNVTIVNQNQLQSNVIISTSSKVDNQGNKKR